ncbi:MAG: FlgD immunoglobulin-like domain containing protein, partial [Candidatus Latescibacterota bacterium]|nr:FlgD immunoglobulin-like domain containing protein [Candidatus Latescibacterota bacterium]
VFFPPQTGLTSDNQRQRDLFARAYEVSRTNVPVEWLIFEDENTSTGSVGYHQLEEIIGSTFANNISIVSLTPELAFTRFLRFKFGETTVTTLLAEIQVFGRGYPEEARYLSTPHSFGEAVSLGRVHWGFTRYRQTSSGEIVADPNAPVHLELQTRAGFDDQPKTFFIFDDLGRPSEVDETTYFKSPRVVERFSEGISGFRAMRGDDADNWNTWSVPYQASGDEIRSSDGAQYLQFKFKIRTEDPMAFGVLDSIAFEISPLLADSALAEISLGGNQIADQSPLVEVPLGVQRSFAYDLRTVAGESRTGYDTIELDVPAAAQFNGLEIDGNTAIEGNDFSLQAANGQFRIFFPETVRQDRSIRLHFSSAIFQASVFLEARIINRTTDVALPQSVEAGDARVDVGSNSVQIVASDVEVEILSPMKLSSSVFTPNGDEINEDAQVSFDLFSVNGGILRVAVLDLAGQKIATLLEQPAIAGPYSAVWDGRNSSGETVPPGIYLVRVEVDVDEGVFRQISSLGVVY